MPHPGSPHTLANTATPDTHAREGHARPTLVLVFECDRLAASSVSIPLADLSVLSIGRGESRNFDMGEHGHLTLPDPWLSTRHAELRTSFGRILLCDTESKNGCRVNGERVQRHELADGDLVELGRTFFIFQADAPDSNEEQAIVDLEGASFEETPFTLNAALATEIAKVSILATTQIAILLLGETGTGKEVLAHHIHRASKRPGEFVPVNCGALPAGLVESELFGHTKGSFSGAVSNHTGLIRNSDRGSLFLDEIADLPSAAQASMLRVLQDSEVRAVGGTELYTVDLRCICATHRDLDAMVDSGDFRSDLYARIAGYRLTLPPLRQRREDLGLLIASFTAQTASNAMSIEAARALITYTWPLNIRELRSCMETASVLAAGSRIELSHLPEALRCAPPAPSQAANSQAGDTEHEAELLRLLQVHNGNVSAVARSMGKDRKQIQRWMKRFAIDPNQFRER